MRLLYVTLTRARSHLMLSLPEDFRGSPGSFLDIWSGGDTDSLCTRLGGLVEVSGVSFGEGFSAPEKEPLEDAFVQEPSADLVHQAVSAGASFPIRRLPHEMAQASDRVRSVRHEVALETPQPQSDPSDPIEYGLWWHETMEYLPWHSPRDSVERYLESRLGIAQQGGFERRGQGELSRFLESGLWRWLTDRRIVQHAEIPVFAPGERGDWIDGVVDLLCVNAETGERTLIDWKTNRRAGGESGKALMERLRSSYHAQLSAYATAVVRALGGTVPTTKIYSSVCGKTVGTVLG